MKNYYSVQGKTIRLTEREVQGILLAIKQYVNNTPVQVYLYGSRVHVDAKGGDIDLLLLFDSVADKTTYLSTKHRLIANIKNEIGDQKIDILIAAKADLEKDAFLRVIFPEGVLLNTGGMNKI